MLTGLHLPRLRTHQVRGPFAWLGHGWAGNGVKYSQSWSPLFDVDYGTPVTTSCRETQPGVFVRQWSKANVSLDCGQWRASIRLRNGTQLR